MNPGAFIARLAADSFAQHLGQLQQSSTDVLIELTIGIVLVGLALLGLALAIIARRDEALRSSEARLSAMVETAGDAILTIDRQGTIRSCNPAGERLFGYEHNELLGQPVDVLMPQPYKAEHPHYLRSYLTTGEAHIIGTERELTALRKDGSQFPILLSVTEFKTFQGRFFSGIVRDISEQKRAEAAEHEQLALAEMLRDTAAVLNSTLDIESVIASILTLVGRVVPHDWADLMLIDQQGAGVTVFSRSGQRDYFQRHSGHLFQVSLTPELWQMLRSQQSLLIQDLDADPRWGGIKEARRARSYLGAAISLGGRAIGFINLDSQTPGFFTTAHANRLEIFANQAAAALENARLYKELEAFNTLMVHTVEERTAQLQHAKDRVETVLNNSPDATLLLDTTGAIQAGNLAFSEMFGYHPDEVYGKSPQVLLVRITPRSWNRMIRKVVRDNRRARFEVIARHKEGSTFEVDLAVSPIQGSGELHGLVCSLRDIRALKQVERMKDAFVSNVSHELRTPVTSLKLFLRLLQRVPLDEHAEIVATLIRETERLNNIINDVLNLSRLDQGSIALSGKEEDLNVVVEQNVSDRMMLARSRGIYLKLDLSPDLPPVWIDSGLAGQALNVLLSNALNYTPATGEVTVRTALRVVGRKHWVMCSVIDTGPGVSAEDRQFLFQRFYRGQAGRESTAPGTGLGLSIANEVMQRHGGKITVESAGIPGQGASFSLWFPLKKARSPRGEPEPVVRDGIV